MKLPEAATLAAAMFRILSVELTVNPNPVSTHAVWLLLFRAIQKRSLPMADGMSRCRVTVWLFMAVCDMRFRASAATYCWIFLSCCSLAVLRMTIVSRLIVVTSIVPISNVANREYR